MNGKIPAAAALIAALVTGAWAWRTAVFPPLNPAALAPTASPRGPVHRLGEPSAAAPAAFWAGPPAQARGRDWVYDLFTPPEIYYDPRSREFTITPPAAGAEEKRTDFGLQLLAVQREPFRLQLVGFVGGEGNYLGVFENLLTTEHSLAGAGRRRLALGATVLDFDVKRQRLDQPGCMPVGELVATARVRDEITGEEITLTSRGRTYTRVLLATVVADVASEQQHEIHSGDTLRLGDTCYRFGRIQQTPPSVEVARESPDAPQPERRTLTLSPLAVTP